MLTFQICSPKAARKFTKPPVSKPVITDNASRAAILKRNVAATWIKVGDYVSFKKPRKNPPKGVVIDIIENPEECHWSGTGIPMNIVMEVENYGEDGGVINTTRIRTNIKKLRYISKGK